MFVLPDSPEYIFVVTRKEKFRSHIADTLLMLYAYKKKLKRNTVPVSDLAF